MFSTIRVFELYIMVLGIIFLVGKLGENLRILTDKLNSKNYYQFNPSFDKKCFKK